MKKLEINSFNVSDIIDYNDQPVGAFDSFYFPMQIGVGPIGTGGEDGFAVLIMSQDKLDEMEILDDYWKRIVLPVFDVKLIKHILKSLVEYCNQKDAPFEELRKHLNWEGENMTLSTLIK